MFGVVGHAHGIGAQFGDGLVVEHEDRQPVLLVVLEHVGGENHRDRRDRSEHEEQDQPHRDIAHRDHHGGNDDVDEHGAEIRLQQDEADRYAGQEQAGRHALEAHAVAGEHGGERDDEHELAGFRRLEREATDSIPGLGPVDVGTEKHDAEEQAQRGDVGNTHEAPDSFDVDQRRKQTEAGADNGEEDLPGEKRCIGRIEFGGGTPGG